MKDLKKIDEKNKCINKNRCVVIINKDFKENAKVMFTKLISNRIESEYK